MNGKSERGNGMKIERSNGISVDKKRDQEAKVLESIMDSISNSTAHTDIMEDYRNVMQGLLKNGNVGIRKAEQGESDSDSDAEEVDGITMEEEQEEADAKNMAEEEGEEADDVDSEDMSSEGEEEGGEEGNEEGDEEGDEEGSEDDFLVPDNEIELEDGTIVIKGDDGKVKEIKKREKKKSSNPFIDDGNEDEDGEDYDYELKEEEYQMAKPMSKDFRPSKYILKIYREFFDLRVLCAIIPGYEKKIRDKVTVMESLNGESVQSLQQKGLKKPTEAEIKQVNNYKIQLDCCKLIEEISENVFGMVVEWIKKNRGREQACDELYSWLLRSEIKKIIDPETKRTIEIENDFGTTDFIEIRRATYQTITCAISKNTLRKGCGWLVTHYTTDGKLKSDVVDVKWAQFLAYWTMILKHTIIIEDFAKGELDGIPLDPLPKERLVEIASAENAEEFLKNFMAALAWFYKHLSGTKWEEDYIKLVDPQWYTIE
jgi:hypothetical protein